MKSSEKKYQLVLKDKNILITPEELKSPRLIVAKLNEAGELVGSGHDCVEILHDRQISCMLLLESYVGGPTWTYEIQPVD